MRSGFERCSADHRRLQQCYKRMLGTCLAWVLIAVMYRVAAETDGQHRLTSATQEKQSLHTLVVVRRVHCSVSWQCEQHGVHAVVQLLSTSTLEVRPSAPADQQCIACVPACPHAACVRHWRRGAARPKHCNALPRHWAFRPMRSMLCADLRKHLDCESRKAECMKKLGKH